jgi:hypothetical protein
MAIPSSGPISFSTIAAERCSSLSNLSLRTMSSLASKTVPDGVSEFYGYTFCPSAGNYCNDFCTGSGGCTRRTNYRNGCNCLCDGTVFTDVANGCDTSSGNFCSSYCSGYNLYYCYSSNCTGACSYCNFVESNSASCGYVPPYYYWYADCGPISISGPSGSFSGQYIEGYFASGYYSVYWSNNGSSQNCACYLYIGTGGYTTSDIMFFVSYYDGGGGCVQPGVNTYGPSNIYIG